MHPEAKTEGIAFTCVAGVLRWSLLAPDIVKVIMVGQQPPRLSLAQLMEPFPFAWIEQQTRWLGGKSMAEIE